MYQMCWWLIIASNIYRKSDETILTIKLKDILECISNPSMDLLTEGGDRVKGAFLHP